jgi:SNF2 family DNA or RNA helicase
MIKNDVFKLYIEANSNQLLKAKMKECEVENLVVGKLGITANVKALSYYKINVVIFQGVIHSTACTCSKNQSKVCEHILAVLNAAHTLLYKKEMQLLQEDVLAQEKRSGHPTTFLFPSFDFKALTNDFIFNHLNDSPSYNLSAYIEELRLNEAVLVVSRSYYEREIVHVSFEAGDLVLECQCEDLKTHLCKHQEKAMYLLKDDRVLRPFFDSKARQTFLQAFAGDYGLSSTENLEDYFEIQFDNKEIKIKSLITGLIPVNEPTIDKFSKQLIASDKQPFEFSFQEGLPKDYCIVFEEARYANDFHISLYSAFLTKEGRIKNPLKLEDARQFIFTCDDPVALKFYAAIGVFQSSPNFTPNRKTTDEHLALTEIVRNSSEFSVYCLNAKQSDKCTVQGLEEVQLKKGIFEFHLKIIQKENFYEITPKLFVDSVLKSFSALKLVYSSFVRVENELIYCADEAVLKAITFFKKQQHKLLIHQDKFPAFQAAILIQLEDKLTIDYTFLQTATPQQYEDFFGDELPVKKVYLSESDSFVLITPVMQYGAIEVPVRSKKRIYLLDALGQPYEIKRDDDLEIRFLIAIQDKHPNFEEQEQFDYFYLNKAVFLDDQWFLNVFEQWQQDGVEILGFNTIKNNAYHPSKMAVSLAVSSGIDWFDTALKVSFGDEVVRLKEIQRSVVNQSNYVRLGDGRLGLMPKEWLEKFAAFFRSSEIHDTTMRTSKLHFSMIEELFKDEVLPSDVTKELAMYQQKFDSFQSIEQINVPKGLKTELRDYQKEGLNWLHFLDSFNFGGCLADDMGLGKTIQIIAFILSLKAKNGKKTHLIVLPTSLLFNWKSELEKFAPSLKFHMNYGNERKKDKDFFKKFDIVFTTYGTLLSDVNFLKSVDFDYIILDESQAIKNPMSKRYKSVRLLQARNRLVLTGTPVENNTYDLFAQFSFLNPGSLGTQQRFKDNYAIPIDKFKDGLRAKELQRKIHPFLLRRTKKQVASELPEKTEIVLFCEMGKEQRAVYDSYKNEFKLYLEKSKKEELLNQSMHVLQGLTKLRQICNSPALLNDEGFYGNESAKIDILIEQVSEQVMNHKLLIFSQFVGMLDLIKERLILLGIPFEYLTGKTKNREEVVRNFQENESIRVFLISLKAGGVGLNLTEADYVYIIDPWWNPAVENQAIDRSYRIGQKRKVIAVRLICPDTIEEKILLLQESKKEMIDDLIKVDLKSSKMLGKEDLLLLLD